MTERQTAHFSAKTPVLIQKRPFYNGQKRLGTVKLCFCIGEVSKTSHGLTYSWSNLHCPVTTEPKALLDWRRKSTCLFVIVPLYAGTMQKFLFYGEAL